MRQLGFLVRIVPGFIADFSRVQLARLTRMLQQQGGSATASGAPAQESANTPRVGHVNFGELRRVHPIDSDFGFSRGNPVDRYYIEGFLKKHSPEIKGVVLEIGDNAYTLRYGRSQVQKSDVLHVNPGNPAATYVGDLAGENDLPDNTFDCVILTQTLHLIFDVQAAVGTAYRILKPGGVLLITVPGISQIDRGEWSKTWFWSFTTASIERLLRPRFDRVEVAAHGNVLAATAFLHGIASKELRRAELDTHDPAYQVIITARAVKSRG
jgi:SAM-dependent methyltransferase